VSAEGEEEGGAVVDVALGPDLAHVPLDDPL
jgi:hypothetical protein